MIYTYKKTLIISPHADDEIFTLPFIYSPENNFLEIDVLLIEHDYTRFKDSLISSNLHNFNLLTMPCNTKFKGLLFHEYMNELFIHFSRIWENYDLILSPIIEGGHQDHDSVCAALLYCKSKIFSKTKLILYSTYSNISWLPILYKCGFSRTVPQKNIFSLKMPHDLLYLFLKTILLSYKSQLSTWILLFPALVFAYLKGDINRFVLADDLDFRDVHSLIPENPLYQTYRNCKREEWIRAFDSMIGENSYE